ncbi:hypothetical protein F5141DRAFT_355061 [Pisolithus sp. B1]|nr:hypothetical protein F5141DRAFT_355061 [Pisolithus sp. B1]
MQQGPPAHVLAKMTPEQRKLYRIALGPSEGGYTAAVKLKLGMKLRKPDLWKLESGRAENLAMLELKENDIMAENERRQRSDTDEIVPVTLYHYAGISPRTRVHIQNTQPSYPHGRGSVAIPSPIRSARRLAHSPWILARFEPRTHCLSSDPC